MKFNWFRHKSEPRPEEPVITVLFTPGEDGYIVAECPQLPGCMSQGKTEDEARENVMDAIRSVLAVRMGMLVSGGPADYAREPRSSEEEYRVKSELVAV
jgi:predicted RNase H-like HicB family nuclease